MKLLKLNNNISDYSRKIAEIHKSAYSKNHFTSCFSQEKLEEYYACLVEASDLSVIAVTGEAIEGLKNNQDKAVGFIIAGRSVSNGVTNFIKSNRMYVFYVMLINPMFLVQKIFTQILLKFIKVTPSKAKFRLLSISVLSGSQSTGVGKAMLESFEKELLGRGVECYGLSVRAINKRAISFYERNGFELENTLLGSKYYFKSLV